MDHHPFSTSQDQEFSIDEGWQVVRWIVRFLPWMKQLSYQWMIPAKQTKDSRDSDLPPNGWTLRDLIFRRQFVKKFWAVVMKKQEENDELLPYAAARSATRCWERKWVRWPSHPSTNIWVACTICETCRWSLSSPAPAAASSTGKQTNQENVNLHYSILEAQRSCFKKKTPSC